MILIVDAGNTNVDVVVYQAEQVIYRERCVTVQETAGDYYLRFFQAVYRQFPKIEGYLISSVVPAITEHLVQLLEGLYHQKGLLVNRELVTDLVINLDHPEELGADLIGTTYGVLAKYPQPAIVADLGTATKISVISAQGAFEGGIIVPGVSVSKKAMEIMIPHLPVIEPVLPNRIMTRDTVQSMQAGLLYGTIYQVKGLVAAIEQEMGLQATKILTGGYSRFIKEKLPEFIYDPDLLTDGLAAIYHRYR